MDVDDRQTSTLRPDRVGESVIPIAIRLALLGFLVYWSILLLLPFIPILVWSVVLAVALSGFSSGMAIPSRDMIVRAATPPGSFGKVFGFVTTGLHVGGMISPLIFGQFLDHGHPRAVFLFIASCAFAAVLTVVFVVSSGLTPAANSLAAEEPIGWGAVPGPSLMSPAVLTQRGAAPAATLRCSLPTCRPVSMAVCSHHRR